MSNSIRKIISCDIVTVVTDYKKFIGLLSRQSSQPQWLRHNIIAILNMSNEDEQKLHSWYYESRVNQVMPEVTLIKAKADLKNCTAAMYNMGIMAGNSPFVYLQSEHDELAENIDKTIFKLYNDKKLQACSARTETFLETGTPIEKFPLLNSDDDFKYDCYEATRLFPSYVDPLSAVFKRSIFNKLLYWEIEYQFKEFTYYHFILRILGDPSIKVTFVPYTIKKSKRKQEFAGNMSLPMRNKLIHDIRLWLPEYPETKYKDFQQEILHLLENNEITTFKEIDARIEDYLESNK